MEKILEQDVQVDVDAAVDNALTHLNAAGLNELICALVLPLLALLIGRIVNRWIDSRPKDSINAHIIDFSAPLLAPLLAVLFLMGAGLIFRAQGVELFILPFVWKLAVAWLAISIVAMVSSRQSTGWLIVLVIVPITLMHLFGVWEPVTNTLKDAEFTVGQSKINAYGALKSGAALIALFWITGFIVQAMDKRLRRIRRMHVSNRVLIMKFFQTILYFVVFLVALGMLGVDFTALSVLGGALGVGIGFGLQKIASNFISGIILLFEKSVMVDDLIMLEDGTTGFIRQNAARYTRIEVADGRDIMIPNEEFITQRVTTLTHGKRDGRIEIKLTVEFDSDIEQVRSLLLEAAKVCKECKKDPAPSAFLTALGDHGQEYSLYLWLDDIVAGTLGPRHNVLSEIMRLFRKHGITLAYPHQVAVEDPDTFQRQQGKAVAAASKVAKKPVPRKPAKDKP